MASHVNKGLHLFAYYGVFAEAKAKYEARNIFCFITLLRIAIFCHLLYIHAILKLLLGDY